MMIRYVAFKIPSRILNEAFPSLFPKVPVRMMNRAKGAEGMTTRCCMIPHSMMIGKLIWFRHKTLLTSWSTSQMTRIVLLLLILL